jgi:SAM-dependent methyltransferase
MTGNMQRASLPLADSPHVKFLEKYLEIGKTILRPLNFEQTAYYKNAMQCVQLTGNYFGQRTVEGIIAQARSFIELYNRITTNNSLEVKFPSTACHSPFDSLPIVRKTWTPKTVQIDDGMHRLAISWVSGRKETTALVLPAMPTKLQSLVTRVSRSQELPGLYQPINSVEFDRSWDVIRRCDERFDMMLRFLSSNNYRVGELSILDLGCSYGRFVSEFLKKGAKAIGLDVNGAALKVGQIAYGLTVEQLVKNDLLNYLKNCDRTYDVVLLLSVLHHFALNPDYVSPAEVLKRADAVTGAVLFIDTGQAHEYRYRKKLPDWDNDFIVNFVKQHSSFDRVIPLGVDSDRGQRWHAYYGRTLFACVRS